VLTHFFLRDQSLKIRRSRIGKLQVPPLSYAPVEMTGLGLVFGGHSSCLSNAISINLSSRPERTRISYHAAPESTTYASFLKERRTHSINATTLHRKSGGAQWRDLQFATSPGEAATSPSCSDPPIMATKLLNFLVPATGPRKSRASSGCRGSLVRKTLVLGGTDERKFRRQRWRLGEAWQVA
jgi:hypothetical protein